MPEAVPNTHDKQTAARLSAPVSFKSRSSAVQLAWSSTELSRRRILCAYCWERKLSTRVVLG